MAAHSETWTFVDGKWLEGNPPLTGPRSHAFWQGSNVFDGARYFEGVAPDLLRHAERVNRSAKAMWLKATMAPDEIVALTHEGAKKFGPDAQLYVRPMYWAESEGPSAIAPDAESTRFLLCIYVAPMPPASAGMKLTLSPFRRPSYEVAPTDGKAGCLYPNGARAILEARKRGFDNALMLDMLGNVSETASSNIFMVKDGVVMTPIPNGTFLNGITRQRTMGLLRGEGREVVETMLRYDDFLAADEIFITGNYSKTLPVIRIDDRDLQPGPVGRQTRELYWAFAHERRTEAKEAAVAILFDGMMRQDYHQIYLCDASLPPLPDDYTEAAIAHRVVPGPLAIIVHVDRELSVPFRVDLHERRPDLDLTAVDQASETAFSVPSGLLVVSALIDDTNAARLPVPAGRFGVIVTAAGLGSLSPDGFDGRDCYGVHLWPSPKADATVVALKPYRP